VEPRTTRVDTDSLGEAKALDLSGPREGRLWTGRDSEGRPFHPAIERGSLAVAETLREIARPTLGELLELTTLITFKERHRHARVSAR
jgi:hypothetical protein